jgi:hypothetical protein
VTPSIGITHPMVFSHSMGTNPFVFLSGMSNHDTQPILWDSNPSFGSGGMKPPYSPFLVWWDSYPSTNSYNRSLEYSFL